MPTQLEAFEQALVANPDDIATHMAYADYLQEHDDPRGLFISVQLMLESTTLAQGQRPALRKQETRLLNDHVRKWLGALAPFLLETPQGYATPYRFVRGWLETISLGSLDLKIARTIANATEVRLLRSLRLHDVTNSEGSGEELVTVPTFIDPFSILFSAGSLGNLRRLELRSCRLSRGDLRILGSPHRLPRLEELILDNVPLGLADCEDLIRSQLHERLSILELRDCGLRDESARILSRANLAGLAFLNVDGNNLTEAGTDALRTAGVRNLKADNQRAPEDIPF